MGTGVTKEGEPRLQKATAEGKERRVRGSEGGASLKQRKRNFIKSSSDWVMEKRTSLTQGENVGSG